MTETCDACWVPWKYGMVEGATASSLLPSVLDPKGLGMDLWSVFVKGGERKVARKSFFLNESGRRATDYIEKQMKPRPGKIKTVQLRSVGLGPQHAPNSN